MANERGNDIHSRLCISQWCVTIQRAFRMPADKGSLSRTDIVLKWKNTERGWAVKFWWDKTPEFPFLRHLLHKCMPGTAPPPNILQTEGGAEKRGFEFWHFLGFWFSEVPGGMKNWMQNFWIKYFCVNFSHDVSELSLVQVLKMFLLALESVSC